MQDFESLLKSSAAVHGHLCPGQVVGVRMAMLGCGLIGLDDPSSYAQVEKADCLSREDKELMKEYKLLVKECMDSDDKIFDSIFK